MKTTEWARAGLGHYKWHEGLLCRVVVQGLRAVEDEETLTVTAEVDARQLTMAGGPVLYVETRGVSAGKAICEHWAGILLKAFGRTPNDQR